MTDDAELLPEGVPGFDDPAYDDLRGLLAEARVTEPVPAEVAARLDDVLAGLAAEASAGGPRTDPATTVPLRKPRRTGSRLLVAAAVVGVVAVGGIGLSRVLEGSVSTFDAASEAESSRSVPGAATDNAGSAGGGTATGGDSLAALPALTSGAFKDDVTLFLTQTVPSAAYSLDSAESPTAPQAPSDAVSETSGQVRDLAALRASGCTPPPADRRQAAYAILLDGRPAVLVVTTGPDGSRTVQALACSGEVLARADLD